MIPLSGLPCRGALGNTRCCLPSGRAVHGESLMAAFHQINEMLRLALIQGFIGGGMIPTGSPLDYYSLSRVAFQAAGISPMSRPGRGDASPPP